MHCLDTNKVLSPDDLDVNLVVTVYSQGLNVSGIPLKIVAINLPFVRCEFLTHPGSFAMDTRTIAFMSVTKEYIKASVSDQIKIQTRPLFKSRVLRKRSTLCDSKGRPHVYPQGVHVDRTTGGDGNYRDTDSDDPTVSSKGS